MCNLFSLYINKLPLFFHQFVHFSYLEGAVNACKLGPVDNMFSRENHICLHTEIAKFPGNLEIA